jgi:primosomal protein N' (replication factor Y)
MKKDHTKSLFATGENDENVSAEHVVRVVFDAGVDAEYDYAVPDRFWPVQVGRRLEVPFGRGNKSAAGFCVAIIDDPEELAKSRRFRLKSVMAVPDAEPLIDSQLMDLAAWISSYYVCPLGQVLAAVVPAAVKKGAGVKKETHVFLRNLDPAARETLTSAKQRAIAEALNKAQAFDEDCGLAKEQLLAEASCTEAPLKQLLRKEIVGIIRREVLLTAPVVPDRLTTPEKPFQLNADQTSAIDHITGAIRAGAFSVTALHGVTDSGKTEVYIRAIERTIAAGRSAIVLLPEIALTAQTVQRFQRRFERLAVMHSQLTGPQRNAQWRMIKAGQADIVVGARSAIFAPLSNLGLIVVDEEHEPGYKQDTTPRYHGRDVAIKRAQLASAHCILGSATPSLETLHNCRTRSHFKLITLPHRVMDLPMPRMRLVDMSQTFRGKDHKGVELISGPLEENLRQVLSRGEQAILLLNRRGYSNFVFCPSCRHALHCPNCDVTLTFHKRPGVAARQTFLGKHMDRGFAICHYCLSKTLVPESCPLCSRRMTMIGLGSQRMVEEVSAKFPDARIRRVDSDTMAGSDPERYYSLLRDFADGNIDILAGTQMLAKGLHFPNVTLVGVISADTSLSLPDFRANERTFQLISQVAGRAGRSEKSGVVIVQTLLPGQPAIELAMENDFAGFVEQELVHRRKCNLPPFWRMAIIRMRDLKFDRLTAASLAMRNTVDDIIARNRLDITVRGPMPCVISRIQRFHRVQIILQSPAVADMTSLFATLRTSAPVKPAVQTAYDIDPINLM